MIKPDLSLELPAQLGSLHFVGIGGSGMSGIARQFLESGYSVSGSDLRDTDAVAELRALGARIHIGHAAENVGDADTLVVTGALWEDNPEYQLALQKGLPVLHRSQALAWLISSRRLISIAGAHGKSTSTGMLVTALRALDADPSFVNGGVIQNLGVSSAHGTDDLFVVEADESDGSFLLYDTAIALITNVDADHLDHYGSHDEFDKAFVTFAERASEFVVASADDAGAVRVTSSLENQRVITFGRAENADVRIASITAGDTVSLELVAGSARHTVELAVPGEHNAVNAAGVVAVLVGLGYELAPAMDAARQELYQIECRLVCPVDIFDHHDGLALAGVACAEKRIQVVDGREVGRHHGIVSTQGIGVISFRLAHFMLSARLEVM